VQGFQFGYQTTNSKDFIMPCIAIIDDRKDFRDTIKTNVDLALEQGWQSLDIDPLENLEQYPHWIKENGIGAILIDERLNERVERTNNYVTYCGHDFVDYIRKMFATLPIFIITSYPNDDSLLERFKDVEEIIDRTDFNKNPNNYVPRFMRSTQQFLDTFEKELVELSKLASNAALGKIDLAEKERMKAIQAKIGFAFPSDIFLERSNIIDECEKVLDQLDELKNELNNMNHGD